MLLFQGRPFDNGAIFVHSLVDPWPSSVRFEVVNKEPLLLIDHRLDMSTESSLAHLNSHSANCYCTCIYGG